MKLTGTLFKPVAAGCLVLAMAGSAAAQDFDAFKAPLFNSTKINYSITLTDTPNGSIEIQEPLDRNNPGARVIKVLARKGDTLVLRPESAYYINYRDAENTISSIRKKRIHHASLVLANGAKGVWLLNSYRTGDPESNVFVKCASPVKNVRFNEKGPGSIEIYEDVE